MFYVNDHVVMSTKMRENRVREFEEFMKRSRHEKDIYDERFKSVYRFFSIVRENY